MISYKRKKGIIGSWLCFFLLTAAFAQTTEKKPAEYAANSIKSANDLAGTWRADGDYELDGITVSGEIMFVFEKDIITMMYMSDYESYLDVLTGLTGKRKAALWQELKKILEEESDVLFEDPFLAIDYYEYEVGSPDANEIVSSFYKHKTNAKKAVFASDENVWTVFEKIQ